MNSELTFKRIIQQKEVFSYDKSDPCPCGYYGSPSRQCEYSSGEICCHHERVSGPLLDRIDIFVDVPHVCYEKVRGISEALRYSSVPFTIDTYSHILPGMQEEAMALLDEVLPAATDGVWRNLTSI